jgi:hypothetical protein
MNNEQLKEYVIKNMYGWWGGQGHCATVLGCIIEQNDVGNHLEIGTLFGATAIYAGLIMEREGINGIVYTVDPCLYETHEYCSRVAGNLSPDIVKHQSEIIYENIKKFELENRIVFINKSSNPIPEELLGVEFNSCFIDGFHYSGMPLIDTKNCVELFNMKHIILDDTHYRYPDVIKALKYLIGLKNWGMSVSYQNTSAFHRIIYKEPSMEISISAPMDKTKLNWPDFMEKEIA